MVDLPKLSMTELQEQHEEALQAAVAHNQAIMKLVKLGVAGELNEVNPDQLVGCIACFTGRQIDRALIRLQNGNVPRKERVPPELFTTAMWGKTYEYPSLQKRETISAKWVEMFNDFVEGADLKDITQQIKHFLTKCQVELRTSYSI